MRNKTVPISEYEIELVKSLISEERLNKKSKYEDCENKDELIDNARKFVANIWNLEEEELDDLICLKEKIDSLNFDIDKNEKSPLNFFLGIMDSITSTLKYLPGELSDFQKEELFKQVEKLDCINPSSYIMPNNKLVNTLTKHNLESLSQASLRVSREGSPQVLTKVSINYDDKNILIDDKDKRFTPYDRAVHNAVCSLSEAGNSNFTPDRVYRAMNGLIEGEYVKPQAIEAIIKSIDKARRIMCTVDYSDEMRARGKDAEKYQVEGYILAAEKITLKTGGREVEGYKLLKKPLLYEYAQATGQVITVPMELLNTKEAHKTTQELTILREYLIRRIEIMKNSKDKRKVSQSNCILISAIFDELDLGNPTKEKAKKIRDISGKLLTYFKQLKHIKNFEFYKEGRSFKGIKISY